MPLALEQEEPPGLGSWVTDPGEVGQAGLTFLETAWEKKRESNDARVLSSWRMGKRELFTVCSWAAEACARHGHSLHWPDSLAAAAVEEIAAHLHFQPALGVRSQPRAMGRAGGGPSQVQLELTSPLCMARHLPESQVPHLSNADNRSKSAFADIYGTLNGSKMP